MAYTGRVAAIAETTERKPVLLYGLSGRSQSSRDRIAVARGNRVSIEPYGDSLTPDTAEASRLVYDAIRTSNWLRLGVVSNGRHTDDIFGKLASKKLLGWFPFYRRDEISDIGNILKKWGHEGKVGDRYNTPRIAGVIDASGGRSWLGMITAEKEDGMYNVTRIRMDRGQARYISTYTGEGEEPQPAGVKEVANPANKQKIAGRKAQELAEEMYGFMDPAFVVAAAAALWDPQQKRWELAVKNKS